MAEPEDGVTEPDAVIVTKLLMRLYGQIHAMADSLGIPMAELQAPRCPHCNGTPPAGYTCNTCKRGS
jgi:hypothetical protein